LVSQRADAMMLESMWWMVHNEVSDQLQTLGILTLDEIQRQRRLLKPVLPSLHRIARTALTLRPIRAATSASRAVSSRAVAIAANESSPCVSAAANAMDGHMTSFLRKICSKIC
jgi:hypothetical protein